MIFSALILAFVTLQRLGELVLARRNTARLLARGGREAGARHYPLIVLLHAAWLAGLWTFALDHQPNLLWLAIFIVLQLLRVWVISSLGERWTTRIIVLPAATLVTAGPYRFVSHPNYSIVAAEILILPLVFGLVWYGVVFSVLNGLVLWLRIRTENAVLKS